MTVKISVVIPATNRPKLARDALLSVLNQSLGPHEIIFSNNGANPQVFAAIRDLLAADFIHYYEQPALLSMPDHWNFLVEKAQGTHLIVVTDRSILKRDAIERLTAVFAENKGVEVISWPWDLYYESGHVRRYKSKYHEGRVAAEEVLIESLDPFSGYPVRLPRALNSCVSMAVIEKIRRTTGSVFGPLNPDYSFAYNCLLSIEWLYFLGRPLMVMQGLNVSNGGHSYLGAATGYISSLGIRDPFKYSPVKAALVENSIIEDFYVACRRYKRLDLLKKFDVTSLYIRCHLEYLEKWSARILSSDELRQIKFEIQNAIAKENIEIHRKVKSIKTGLWRRHLYLLAKRVVPYAYRDRLRALLFYVLRVERSPSALKAAGFM